MRELTVSNNSEILVLNQHVKLFAMNMTSTGQLVLLTLEIFSQIQAIEANKFEFYS